MPLLYLYLARLSRKRFDPAGARLLSGFVAAHRETFDADAHARRRRGARQRRIGGVLVAKSADMI